jgi:transcriptional regulator with XRE-family HTH domain
MQLSEDIMDHLSTQMTLPARLRAAREQAGLSQGQVAKMMGPHRPSISEIEAGRRKVSANELTQLARIYAVSISWLTEAEDQASGETSARIELAARGLANLKRDDLNKVIALLNALRDADGDECQ